MQNRPAEAVHILDSENAGLSSRIANNDRTFMMEKIQCMGLAGLWKEAYAYAKGLLAVPEDDEARKSLLERDDWKIWNLLLNGLRNLTDDKGYESWIYTCTVEC